MPALRFGPGALLEPPLIASDGSIDISYQVVHDVAATGPATWVVAEQLASETALPVTVGGVASPGRITRLWTVDASLHRSKVFDVDTATLLGPSATNVSAAARVRALDAHRALLLVSGAPSAMWVAGVQVPENAAVGIVDLTTGTTAGFTSVDASVPADVEADGEWGFGSVEVEDGAIAVLVPGRAVAVTARVKQESHSGSRFDVTLQVRATTLDVSVDPPAVVAQVDVGLPFSSNFPMKLVVEAVDADTALVAVGDQGGAGHGLTVDWSTGGVAGYPETGLVFWPSVSGGRMWVWDVLANSGAGYVYRLHVEELPGGLTLDPAVSGLFNLAGSGRFLDGFIGGSIDASAGIVVRPTFNGSTGEHMLDVDRFESATALASAHAVRVVPTALTWPKGAAGTTGHAHLVVARSDDAGVPTGQALWLQRIDLRAGGWSIGFIPMRAT